MVKISQSGVKEQLIKAISSLCGALSLLFCAGQRDSVCVCVCSGGTLKDENLGGDDCFAVDVL